MPPERHTRPAPRERTFAEVFPWRNIRRALMLVLLILAIVMIKRSAGPWLARMGEMWGQPATRSTSTPASSSGAVHKIRLGPAFDPPIPASDTHAK